MTGAARIHNSTRQAISLATITATLTGAYLTLALCHQASAQTPSAGQTLPAPDTNRHSIERYDWPSLSIDATDTAAPDDRLSESPPSNETTVESVAERILRIASDPLLPLEVRRSIVIGEINGAIRKTRPDQKTTNDSRQAAYWQLSRHFDRMNQQIAQLNREQIDLYNRLNELSIELRQQKDLLAQLAPSPRPGESPSAASPSAVARTAAWITNDRHVMPPPSAPIAPNPVPNLDELTFPTEHPARILVWDPEFGYRVMEVPVRSETPSAGTKSRSRSTSHRDDLEAALNREIEVLDRWLDSLNQQTESMRQRRQALDRRRSNLLEPVYQPEQNLEPLPESIDQ